MIYITVGNIGTGKSTTTKMLMSKIPYCLTVSDDAICTLVNGGKYDAELWSDKHRPLYSAIKFQTALEAVARGFDIVIDGCHISKESRKKFIEISRMLDVSIICYLHSDHKLGLQRRMENPKTYKPKMWIPIYERFKKQYEEPSLNEGFKEIVMVN